MKKIREVLKNDGLPYACRCGDAGEGLRNELEWRLRIEDIAIRLKPDG